VIGRLLSANTADREVWLVVSTTAVVVLVLTLAVWHLRTRRHLNWNQASDARFYITSGYPLVAIAVYFLSSTTTGADWEWVLGNFWALAAMTAFVYGFNALNGLETANDGAAHFYGQTGNTLAKTAPSPPPQTVGRRMPPGTTDARAVHRRQHH
jgi:hypothetical protein